MISRLRGKIIDCADNAIIIDVNGVGFSVRMARLQEYTLNQEVNILTHLHWHQEQGPQLFGFLSNAEKQVFHLILGCSGLGPKIALSILNAISPDIFASAIVAGDVKTLSRVDGIGTKKAESIIVQLKDKIAKLLQTGSLTSTTKTLETLTKVNDILTSLGYSRLECTQTVEYIQKTDTLETASFDELIRKALSFAAKKN